jgi:hypothetical protein
VELNASKMEKEVKAFKKSSSLSSVVSSTTSLVENHQCSRCGGKGHFEWFVIKKFFKINFEELL